MHLDIEKLSRGEIKYIIEALAKNDPLLKNAPEWDVLKHYPIAASSQTSLTRDTSKVLKEVFKRLIAASPKYQDKLEDLLKIRERENLIKGSELETIGITIGSVYLMTFFIRTVAEVYKYKKSIESKDQHLNSQVLREILGEEVQNIVSKQDHRLKELLSTVFKEIEVEIRSNTIKVLMLSAEPKTRDPINFLEEYKKIKDVLRESKTDQQFNFDESLNAVPDDIGPRLMAFDPAILHLSVHGEPNCLIFQNEHQQEKKVPLELFLDLIWPRKDQLKIVLFNACDSFEIAKQTVRVINFSIGMRKQWDHIDAGKFAGGFYAALGDKQSVNDAFNQGLRAVNLTRSDQKDVPILFCKYGTNPATFYMV